MTKFERIKNRGYIYQSTDDEALPKLLDSKLTFYVGHLLPIMLIRELVKMGHQAIILIGGGTALIGDPSGKKEARKMLDENTVKNNAAAIRQQLINLVSDNDSSPIFIDNSDWLCQMKMIYYLRELGSKFSINKMLSAESVKQRLETGISYLEFSYMILQAYDFLKLYEDYNCTLQIGGQDQWGNIVAGTDIIRRFKSIQAYGITVPLLLTPTGEKFGKTANGTVWLSSSKTSDFDYYQFWRNVPDSECKKMLSLFTELPDDEIEELSKLQAPQLNRTKEILAFECTKIARGFDSASKAYLAAGAKFGFADPEGTIKTSSSIITVNNKHNTKNLIPSVKINLQGDENEIWVIRLFTESGLCSSSSEARRLIHGGGAYLNGEKITDINAKIPLNDLKNKEIIVAAGKKNFKRLIFNN